MKITFYFALLICLVMLCSGEWTTQQTVRAENNVRPAILFAVPYTYIGGSVDLNYLRSLRDKGFEVDYVTGLDNLNWDLIKKYNALVIYGAPGGETYQGTIPVGKLSRDDMDGLLERYVQAGGGVLFLAAQSNAHRELLPETLMKRWGFRIAAETINETDEANCGSLAHAEVPLAYAQSAGKTPVSDGIEGAWYPNQYSGSPNWCSMTAPLWLDDNWQVVLRASPTAKTAPVDFKAATHPPAAPYFHSTPLTAPPIFAIRSAGKGRVAVAAQYPQFTVGSGTKWIFNNDVLSGTIKGKRSDMGRLLLNTFQWLTQPSLEAKTLGGFVTDPVKLVEVNDRPEARATVDGEFGSTWPNWKALSAQRDSRQTARGLIGVQTNYGAGQNTVAEYASAAKRLGLQFVIFLDSFTELTPAEFESLKADCIKYSDAGLKLFAGFTIQTNVGNSMFIYGPSLTLPPAQVLTGPNKNIFEQQIFESREISSLAWLLKITAENRNDNQIGFYNFNEAVARGGMDLPNTKMYSMAAVRYFRDGKMVEDITDRYLVAAQATIPPVPVSLNEVLSVAEMEREVKANRGLTYARVSSLEKLHAEALRYAHQYDSIPVFTSDGPMIETWNGVQRVATYGGQDFQIPIIAMPTPIAVSAAAGLKEIRIYNGKELFRRFVLNGEKEWKTMLPLEAAIQKNLVLIAEDNNGGKAVSTARRSWKDGTGGAVVFCSDHINDCKSPANGPVLLAHGPFSVAVTNTPLVPDPGYTWDGGPAASRPLAAFPQSTPVLVSDKGTENGVHFEQTPLLEFADEGGVAITSIRKRVFDKRIPHYNPWWAWGPTAPSQLMDYTSRFRQWNAPTIGPSYNSWPGEGQRSGAIATLHAGEITFKAAQSVQSLKLLGNTSMPFHSAFLTIGRTGAAPETIDLSKPDTTTDFRIGKGEWFGLFTLEMGNTGLFINRGETILLKVDNPKIGNQWATINAGMNGKSVEAGDKYTYEILAVTYPLESSAKSAAELARMVDYFKQPDGLNLQAGTRVPTPGIVQLKPVKGSVEFSLPRPAGISPSTLPVRVSDLNPRWSAWRWQKAGYEKGDYGNGVDRFSPLGLDSDGNAYIPIYATWAPGTHVAAGHPIIADSNGRDLFIQVTPLGDAPMRWHVSVNNPTEKTVTTTLTRAMNLPGLNFETKKITVLPGKYLVLTNDDFANFVQNEKAPARIQAVDMQLVDAPAVEIPAVKTGENLALNSDLEKGIEGWMSQMLVEEDGKGKIEKTPQFLSWEENPGNGSKGALKVTIKLSETMKEPRAHNSGALALAKHAVPPTEDLLITFKAKHLSGAKVLRVNRLWGGATSNPVTLTDEWKTYQVVIRSKSEMNEIIFAPVATPEDPYAVIAEASFLLDDVRIETVEEAPPVVTAAPNTLARVAKATEPGCCGTSYTSAPEKE